MVRLLLVLILSTLVVGSCFSTQVSAQEVDGPIAREHLKRQTADLLYREKFSQLEKMATQLRSDKATFPDGQPKLHFFYEAFLLPKNRTSDGWIRFMAKLKAWYAKYPDSITARTALAYGWMNYGWQARGGGYANTVTDEGWRLLAERLDKAEALLTTKPAKSAEDSVIRHYLLLLLAKSKGADRPHFDSLFQKAVTFDPSYAQLYLQKGGYLDPRWHGEEGDWQRFAEETAKIPEIGKILYMRLAWSQYLVTRFKSFEEAGVSWPLMKQGFIDARHSFPKSPWLLNNFCKFACLAGDKETARALFLEIGDSPYIDTWDSSKRIGNVDDYQTWRAWALGGETAAKFVPSPQGTESFRETLILAKSGDAEAQYKAGQLLDGGEQVKQDRVEAERWLRKAAEQGHVNAQMMLGMLYYNASPPIRRDFKEAAKWFYLAAMQGEPNVPSVFSSMYDTGYGLEKDPIQAYIWYSLNPRWKDKRIEEIAATLSPEQVAKADLDVKRLRSQIQANLESAEIIPLNPANITLPAFKIKDS